MKLFIFQLESVNQTYCSATLSVAAESYDLALMAAEEAIEKCKVERLNEWRIITNPNGDPQDHLVYEPYTAHIEEFFI